MKSKTEKLTYRKRNRFCIALSLLVFLLFISLSGYTQQLHFDFNNTPVSEALLKVARTAKLRIAFDAGNLERFSITKSIDSDRIEEVLAEVLEGTDYISGYKHNTWLIIKTIPDASRERIEKKRISGVVYDETSGERLPYASIYIWDNNQFLPASVDGTFTASVKNLPQSYFQVKYLGYQTFDSIVDITKINDVLLFGLKQQPQNITTIDVEGDNLEMLRYGDEAGHFTFNPRRFIDLPNYGEPDIFRALQFLPGISAQENSSQLNIRGSSADQNLVKFDGFTLYNLDHFFGVFSAINPNVIKDIQVYKGGFDARYGERVSGIVDITGKSGNKSKTEIYGGINLISGNLTAEIPISKKLTLVTAARRAYSDLYSSWLTDAILADKIGQSYEPREGDNTIKPEFYFGDFNTKLTWALNDNENISFSLYGAKDYLNSSNASYKDSVLIDTDDQNKWGNYGLGLSWKKQYGSKYFTNLQFGYSGYYNKYDNNTTVQGASSESGTIRNTSNKEDNRLTDFSLSYENTFLLNESHFFEFGLLSKYNEYKYYKEANTSFVYSELYSGAMLYTSYFQDKMSLSKKLYIKPGFRLNYFDNTDKFYFEPRFSATYNFSKEFLVKLATGRYYQFLNKSASEQTYGYNRDFWVIANGDVNPVVSSNHFIVGASLEKKKFFFDLEAYYKTLDGLQEYLFFINPDNRPGKENIIHDIIDPNLSKFVSGKGEAYGIDFLAKYTNTKFTSWLAYSLSKSTRNFSEINDGEDIPAIFDQTHELKWTNLYDLNKWNFSTLMIYNTGHPYIKSTSQNENFNTVREYERLPNYFRVDFSLNYNFNFKKVNIKPGLSVLNVFNTDNYLDVYVRNFNVDGAEVNETTLVKAQELTFNFFVNFSF